jgi:predicted DNA-binding transcriptional regulator YafY
MDTIKTGSHCGICVLGTTEEKMKQQQRGKAESSWLAARRCLALLLRLQAGSASKESLLEAVYQYVGEDAYGDADGEALNGRFEGDKNRLEKNLQIKIAYSRVEKGYAIIWHERPFLNLPDHDLETLAYLADTFKEGSPRATDVRQLIDRLIDWLPSERRKRFYRLSGQQPTADLHLRDSEEIAPDVWEAVLEAWQAKQELQFDYLSSQQEDGQKRQHHIQPWDLDFTERGHWQLRGFCLFNDGPNGPWHPNDYINYRVSRIVSGNANVLPRKLPGVRPNGRPRQVIFELAPSIARFGISHRKELIGEPQITPLDGGWVHVEGQTHDVFDLARNLLYYGKNCHVLGGKELQQEMQELVRGLRELYE